VLVSRGGLDYDSATRPHRRGGGHNAAYWSREVGQSMAVQYAVMRRHLAAKQSAAGKE
jgi:hypothetical protein